MQTITGSLEAIIGGVVVGWAAPATGEAMPVGVDLLLDGRVIGHAITSVHRPDVAAAGLMPVAGFRALLDVAPWAGEDRIVTARVTQTGEFLPGALALGRPAFAENWPSRPRLATPAPMAGTRLPVSPLSIVIRQPSDGEGDLARAIAGVRSQIDGDWRLLIVADAACVPRLIREDARISVVVTSGDFAADFAATLDWVTGRHVLLVEPWAMLEPEAVGLLRLAAAGGADLVYGDEASTSEDGGIRGARLCPAFSHDLFLAKPFFGGCYMASTDTARAATVDNRAGSSSDPAVILRLIERAATISHVPALLSRVTGTRNYPPADRRAVEDHLVRIGRPARVLVGPATGIWRVDDRDDGGRVLIVIPTKDAADLVRQSIESIRRTTRPRDVDIVLVDHDSRERESLSYFRSLSESVRVLPYSGDFNFAAINNYAVEKTVGDHRFVLFLNNDVEALRPGWLEHMRGLAGRRDVGVVGATLLYDNEAIQHGGVLIGMYGTADHSHKYHALNRGNVRLPGYLGSMAATRDYSAVTGACMMLRTDVFKGVGGFDERLVVDYNDVDLCLRIGSLGLKILIDAHAVLKHHESATRSTEPHPSLPLATRIMHRRWGDIMAGGDPFYHPMLSLSRVDHAIERLTCAPRARMRWLWAPAVPFREATAEAIDRRRQGSALPHVDHEMVATGG